MPVCVCEPVQDFVPVCVGVGVSEMDTVLESERATLGVCEPVNVWEMVALLDAVCDDDCVCDCVCVIVPESVLGGVCVWVIVGERV